MREWRTGIFWNGRLRKAITQEEKLAFLFAYENAISFSGVLAFSKIEEFSEYQRSFWPSKMTYDEARRSLDLFFDVPENGFLPIPDALTIISAKSSGASNEEIENRRIERRKVYSK